MNLLIAVAEKSQQFTWPEAFFYSILVIAGAVVFIAMFKD